MSKNKKFSSFKKQQVLTENWRSFLLGEQTVEVLPPDYEFLDDDDKSIPVRTKDDAPIDLSGGITDDKGKKKKKKIHRPLDVDEYYRKMMMSDESEQDWEEYQVRGWDPEKHRTGELRTKGPKWAGKARNLTIPRAAAPFFFAPGRRRGPQMARNGPERLGI